MLIHFEHFDLYGTSTVALGTRGYAFLGGAPLIVAGGSRTGSHYFAVGNTNRSQVRYALPSPLAVVGSGCAIRCPAAPAAASASPGGIRFVPVTGNTIRVLPNDLGGVSVFNGTVLLGSSAPGLIPLSTWVWLEARVTTGAGTVGAVEVRLNGGLTPIINLTGLALTNAITAVTLGMENAAGQSICDFDDWIIWDTAGGVNDDFMGDTFVIVAAPSADGTPNSYVPSSGTDRWAMVDEATPNDTDFITANAVGDAQEFAHVAVNLPAGAVSAIATQVRAFKTDAGASSLRVGIASGASTSMGTEVALGTGALTFSHISNRDPNGNVLWTQSAAQAARLRLERAA